MFLLLNGSFGIGKTTVAELLQCSVPGAKLYNPENIGFVLRRLPPFLMGRVRHPPDYQDLPLWRALIARGAQRTHRGASVVVVPMAFTELSYLDAFADALRADGEVQRYCLVAPLPTVTERLEQRARTEGRAVTDFERDRSAECVAAHSDPAFGVPIGADRPPAEIVIDIRARAGI